MATAGSFWWFWGVVFGGLPFDTSPLPADASDAVPRHATAPTTTAKTHFLMLPLQSIGAPRADPPPRRPSKSTDNRRGRMVKAAAALLWATLLLLFAPAARADSVMLLGRSVDGRPISAREVGDPGGTRILVVGCIHGNEPAGIAIARRLAQLSPANIDLWIVSDLNPDGKAAGTRGNAHGVDLNRNFPFRWRPIRGVFESGPRPLSEPE